MQTPSGLSPPRTGDGPAPPWRVGIAGRRPSPPGREGAGLYRVDGAMQACRPCAGIPLIDSDLTHRYAARPIRPASSQSGTSPIMPVHAFIFPGQGSQAVGMGRDLAAAFAAAREVFEEVDETLKQKLSKLMFEGPGEELTLTENTQPALMAHSLAVLRVLESEGRFTLEQKALVVAGHSLGEYSALAAAGAFSVATAARLLKLRGQAMQKAVPAGLGAMAALLGAEMDQAQAICAEAAPLPDVEGSEV